MPSAAAGKKKSHGYRQQRSSDGRRGTVENNGQLRTVASFCSDRSVAKYYAQRRDIWPPQTMPPPRPDGGDDEDKAVGDDEAAAAAFVDGQLVMSKRAWFEASLWRISTFVADELVKSVLRQRRGGSAAAQQPLGTDTTKAPKALVIIDAFCGVGVDAICLAMREQVSVVVALDTDPIALEALATNARVYGLQDKIITLAADVFDPRTTTRIRDVIAARLGASAAQTAVIAAHFSPPWGGPAYLVQPGIDCSRPPFVGVGEQQQQQEEEEVVVRSSLTPTTTRADTTTTCFDAARRWGAAEVACFLPRNSLLEPLMRQVAVAQQQQEDSTRSCTPARGTFRVVSHATSSGKVKGISVFASLLLTHQ